ncbi:MAG: SDR family oxidoreductase [Chloroflexi bacterium]|nr:SDR family oxidoreductase [Chloroflexota bacterium]
MTDEQAVPAGAIVAGKRVIVTGGASGIGRATASLLAARGARVVVLDRDDAAAAQLIAEVGITTGRALGFEHVDVSIEAEVKVAVAGAVTRLGGVDVLLHAAGIMAGQLEDIRSLSEATWDRVVDVNLKGAFLVAKHVAAEMLDAGSGAIVLVSSKAGVAVGSGSFPYGASKGGMHGLVLTLERHLSPKGIRVNEVCPGDIDTPLYRASLAEALAQGADPGAIEEALRTLTAPTTIAEVLAFLASDSASAIRGTIFTT